jgi:hypothetical protein
MALRSERRFIGIGNVTSGMLIQFYYTKLNGENNQYVVLVVDPNRRNDRATEPQLHGYVVKDLTDAELIDFISEFKTSITLDYENRSKAVVEDLNTDESYERFKSSKYFGDRPYRTFNISKMSQVRQILIGSPED